MQSKYKYLGKNTIIFGISSFGTKFLSFILVPLYTSVLSTTEYGISDLITTTATLLGYILTINISSAVLRFTLENRQNRQNILSFGIRILYIGTLICSIILVVAYKTNLLNWPIHYYIYILLYFFSTALYELMTSYLRAIDKIKEVAIAGVFSSAFIIAGNLLFLLLIKIGLLGYLTSIIIGPLFASIYCILVSKAPKSSFIFLDCKKSLKKEMIAYCVPLVFNNMALWINVFLDHYFVTYFCGVAENGIYAVAGKISTILSTCFSIFSSAWTLSAIIEFDPEDKDRFFTNTYNVYSALMTILTSLIIFINIPLARFLYSKDFFVAWNYSSILLFSVMFNTLTVFQGSVFSAAKQTQVVATTSVISAVINTILNILFIPWIGALGAAISTAFSYFSMWVIRFFFLRKIIKMRICFYKDLIVYLLLTVQIVFEHLQTHCYIGQLLCIIAVFAIEWKQLKPIAYTIIRKFNYVYNNKDI